MDFCCSKGDVCHGLLLFQGRCLSWTFVVPREMFVMDFCCSKGDVCHGLLLFQGRCLSWTFVVPREMFVRSISNGVDI